MPAAVFNSSLGRNRDDVGDSLKLHVTSRFQHQETITIFHLNSQSLQPIQQTQD
jgi:hypothetical protein